MNYKRKEVIGDCERTTAIYALCEADNTPRYVGKTVMYLHQRHKAHLRAAQRGGRLPVNRWLKKRISEGDWLTIRLLEYVPPNGDWIAKERYWIARYRDEGFDLLNLTDGGEGLAGHKFTQSHKDKIAAALRTGEHFNCEACGKQFWRKRNQIEKGQNRFCSRKCANRYDNKTIDMFGGGNG